MSFYVPGSSTQIMYTFSRNTINDPFTRAASWGWGNTTYGRIYLNNGYYLYNGNIYDDESTSVGTFTGLNGNLYMLYNIPDTNFFVIQAGSAIHTYKVNQDGTIVEFPLSITSSVVRRWGEPLFSEQHTYFLTNNDYESPNITQTNIISSITRGSVTYTALIDANAESHDVLAGKKYYKNNGLHVGSMPNNGELNYTPSTEEQTIPLGYTSGGIISAVTSAIDQNIQAGNIKSGVTILGVEGTLGTNVASTFNDTNAELYTKIQNQYDNMTPRILTNNDKYINNNIYCIPVKRDGTPLLDTSKVTDMYGMFDDYKNLTTIPLLDTSNVTNMYRMFANCINLTTIPELNTSKVTNMRFIFSGCTNLTTIPLLDTSKVTDMRWMFGGCSSLSDDSLNNIMQMCINATSYTGPKTLEYIDITSKQADKCKTLSNYSAFTSAGWTTGY